MSILTSLWDVLQLIYSMMGDMAVLLCLRFFPDKLSYLKVPHWLPKDAGNIVITGGSTGLGFETARYLARFGHRIIITGRDENKGKAAAQKIKDETGNNRVDFFPCDFASFKSVRALGARINALNIPIHVLVNNAGTQKMKRELTCDGLETVFQVNHASVQLLTTLLLERIKEAKPSGRIVTLSSGGQWFTTIDLEDLQNAKKSFGFGFLVYCRTKIANILFAKELQRRLNKEGRKDILSVLVHPSLVATELARESGMGHLLQGPALTPEVGARGQIYAALAPAKDLVPGGYYLFGFLFPVRTQANDPKLASRLWEITEKLYSIPIEQSERDSPPAFNFWSHFQKGHKFHNKTN